MTRHFSVGFCGAFSWAQLLALAALEGALLRFECFLGFLVFILLSLQSFVGLGVSSNFIRFQ